MGFPHLRLLFPIRLPIAVLFMVKLVTTDLNFFFLLLTFQAENGCLAANTFFSYTFCVRAVPFPDVPYVSLAQLLCNRN